MHWYACELLSINGPWKNPLGESRESSYFDFVLITHYRRLIDNQLRKIDNARKMGKYGDIMVTQYEWYLVYCPKQAIFIHGLISRVYHSRLRKISREDPNEDPKRDRNEILRYPEATQAPSQTIRPVRNRFSRFHFRLGQARLYRSRSQVKIVMSAIVERSKKRLEVLSGDLDFYKRGQQ